MTIPGGKRRANLALALCAASRLAACGSAAATAAATPVSTTTWVFSAPGDTRGDTALSAVAPRIDAVVSGWIQLDSITGLPIRLHPDDAARFPSAARRLALVTSLHGQRFHPETVRRVAADHAALALTAGRIGDFVAAGGYQGVVFDLEGQSRDDIPLALRFIRAAGDSARRRGASTIVVALPAADTTAYPTRAYLAAADFVTIMLYDEHGPTSAPGPIASPTWVRRNLAQRVSDVGAARVVALFPLFGYLWRPNQPATTLSLDAARRAAAEAGVEITRDPASHALHANLPNSWELWLNDAELLRALRSEAADLGVTTIAVASRPL
ncbi:MAG: polysaccharide deacetylase [Gemmatimonadetes bacterium]|nr:polysaccharide deacetylase [Gemmatimonadota bacterium]